MPTQDKTINEDIFARFEVTGTRIEIPEKYILKEISPGLLFPQSYLDFVNHFGYGLTCGLFIIYPPLGKYPDSFSEQTHGITCALTTILHPEDPGYDFLYRPDGSRELISGLVGFATGENGESLFWDTLHPSDDGEYPIYVSGRGMGIRYAGASLREFFYLISAPEHFKKIMAFDTTPLPLTFRYSQNSVFLDWLAKENN